MMQTQCSYLSIVSDGRKFIAVGCSTGVYVARRGSDGMSPTWITAQIELLNCRLPRVSHDLRIL